MRRLLLLLTAAAAIGATPGPSQPSRERGPSPRDAQRGEVRPEAGRHQPARDEHRPALREGRGEPGRQQPQGPQAFGQRTRGPFPGPVGFGSALRERIMSRRMEWMQRMRSHGMDQGRRPDARQLRRFGPDARNQGPGFSPGRGARPQGVPQFRGPSQFQGPRQGMIQPGPDRRPSVGQERGRPDAVRDRGPQPAPEARGRAHSGPENDSPEVKKAREALEKARRALAEADERYDKAVQNARSKPSSEKKPEQPEKKESKRSDKGR